MTELCQNKEKESEIDTFKVALYNIFLKNLNYHLW